MPSLWPQTWTLVILTEPKLFKQYGTVVPMTQMTYKKDVSFRSLGGALRSTADLPWKVAESVFPTEKEEHVIRLRWSQRGLWGWPSPFSPWRTRSVWFHRTLQPLLATARRKTLWRVNGVWPPELTSLPNTSPSTVPWPLSYPWDSSSVQQVFMQSGQQDFKQLSIVLKLFLFPSQPP